MSEMPDGNKVLGIPVQKFTLICYTLILISAGFGVFSSLLALIGAYVPGSMITGLLGLIGIALVVTAWVAFKEKFTELDISHFQFLVIVFVAFLVIYIVAARFFLGLGAFGAILMFLVVTAQFLILLSGFKTYKDGLPATKDNVSNSFYKLKEVISRKAPK